MAFVPTLADLPPEKEEEKRFIPTLADVPPEEPIGEDFGRALLSSVARSIREAADHFRRFQKEATGIDVQPYIPKEPTHPESLQAKLGGLAGGALTAGVTGLGGLEAGLGRGIESALARGISPGMAKLGARTIAPGAAGAMFAEEQHMDPTSAALLGAGLGGGLGLGALGIGKLRQLPGRVARETYEAMAPYTKEELEELPKDAYLSRGKKHFTISNQASDLYDSLKDRALQLGHRLDNNAYFDEIRKMSDEAKETGGKLGDEQLEILNQIGRKPSHIGITGQKIYKEGAPGVQLDHFGHYMEADKKLNKLYRDYKMRDNPGLERIYARAKSALNDVIDNNAENLPPELKRDYDLASGLWKEKSRMEIDPVSKRLNPWYKNWRLETDKGALLRGEKEPDIGPTDTFKKMFKGAKEPGKEDFSKQIGEYLSHVDEDTKNKIMAQVLNPKAKSKFKPKEMLSNLEKYSTKEKKVIFGDMHPTIAKFEDVAKNKRGPLALQLAALAEGMYTGHPVLTYLASKLLPKSLERSIKVPEGK